MFLSEEGSLPPLDQKAYVEITLHCFNVLSNSILFDYLECLPGDHQKLKIHMVQ